jgi:integrase
MREISRFDVEQFRQHRRQTTNGRGGPRSPASVDQEIQLLSRTFSLAIERGEIEVNPCLRMKMMGTGNQVLRYLRPEEEQRLLPVLNGRCRHLLDIVLIDLHTGMRPTEILSLHWSQIDFVEALSN